MTKNNLDNWQAVSKVLEMGTAIVRLLQSFRSVQSFQKRFYKFLYKGFALIFNYGYLPLVQT